MGKIRLYSGISCFAVIEASRESGISIFFSIEPDQVVLRGTDLFILKWTWGPRKVCTAFSNSLMSISVSLHGP